MNTHRITKKVGNRSRLNDEAVGTRHTLDVIRQGLVPAGGPVNNNGQAPVPVPAPVAAAAIGNDLDINLINEGNNPAVVGAERLHELEGGEEVEELRLRVPDDVVLSKDDHSLSKGSWTKSNDIKKHQDCTKRQVYLAGLDITSAAYHQYLAVPDGPCW
jgi:hypothetical protein